MNSDKITFIRAGDSALFCRISDNISLESSQYIIGLHKIISNNKPSGVLETVPSYTGLMLYYNPHNISLIALENIIRELYNDVISDKSTSDYRLLEIPVCYEKAYAPDIDIVSEITGLNIEELIELHTSAIYLVNMVGFTPGFPYLAGMNKKLNIARKKEPRLKIKAGSVGIAGNQTGIYPIESPGGWQIIGRTPLRLYNKDHTNPFLFRAGDKIKFRRIGLSDYFQIGEAVRLGNYKPDITKEYERSQDN